MEDFKKRNNGAGKTMNKKANDDLKNNFQKPMQFERDQKNQREQNKSPQEESRYFSQQKNSQSSMKNTSAKKCACGCDCSNCNNCKPCKPCK